MISIGDRVKAFDSKKWDPNKDVTVDSIDQFYSVGTITRISKSGILVDVKFDYDNRISKGHLIVYLRPWPFNA